MKRREKRKKDGGKREKKRADEGIMASSSWYTWGFSDKYHAYGIVWWRLHEYGLNFLHGFRGSRDNVRGGST